MEEKNYKFVIPDNVTKKGRILGFRRKNLIEASVAALVFGFLIGLIPFVLKVRIIVTAILAGACFVFFLIGIRRRSVSEWLLAWLKYKNTPDRMSFCSPLYKKERSVQAYTETGEHLSFAEQVIALVKQLVHAKLTEGNGKDANTLQKVINGIRELLGERKAAKGD